MQSTSCEMPRGWSTSWNQDCGRYINNLRYTDINHLRGCDGWKPSLTQWTWVWISSRSWWWTGKPDMLQSRGLQRIGHKWRTELNWRYTDDTTLMAESKELKSFLMKVKEESEKVGLKLYIQKTKVMASGPITSWQIEGGKWKQWQILFSWTPKSLQQIVTAAMKLKLFFSLV